MATVMTGIFIICNIPPGINYLVDRYSKNALYRQRIPLSNLLVCVNSASNMMIYCVFNSRFRRAAIKLLGCPSLLPVRAGSVVTRLTRDETTGMVIILVPLRHNVLSVSAALSRDDPRESAPTQSGNADRMLEGDDDEAEEEKKGKGFRKCRVPLITPTNYMYEPFVVYRFSMFLF